MSETEACPDSLVSVVSQAFLALVADLDWLELRVMLAHQVSLACSRVVQVIMDCLALRVQLE
jgi:hypothetical protein